MMNERRTADRIAREQRAIIGQRAMRAYFAMKDLADAMKSEAASEALNDSVIANALERITEKVSEIEVMKKGGAA